jgi:AhpD family alkylhydroperoxidase
MRIDYREHPEIVGPMRGLSRSAREGPLEPLLIEVVKIRASQLNGCAHCLEMHTKDARAMGESDDRLHLVAAWRDAPLFSDRERAALLWCEELTLLSERDVADDTYDAVRRVFTEDELCQLTLAVVTINAWNRFAVAFRAPVGDHLPRVTAGQAHP